jgi:hypothetical protein
MAQKYLVKAAAWLEIIVGIALIVFPNLASTLLFAAALEGPGVPVARFAGIGLISLGCACLSATAAGSPRGAEWGLLIFNVAAAILFVWVGLATTLHGLLLWPAAILHAGLAAGLASGGGLRKTR